MADAVFALRIAVPRGGIEKPNAFVIGGFKRRFGLRLGDNFVRITECAAAKAQERNLDIGSPDPACRKRVHRIKRRADRCRRL